MKFPFRGDIPKNALSYHMLCNWVTASCFSFSTELKSSSIFLRSSRSLPFSSSLDDIFESKDFNYHQSSSIKKSFWANVSASFSIAQTLISASLFITSSSWESSSIHKFLFMTSCFKRFLSFQSSNISFSSHSLSSSRSMTFSLDDFTESLRESKESFDLVSILEIS